MYIGFKSKLILNSSPGASVGFLSTSLQPSIYQVGLILIYSLYFIANSVTDVGKSRLASVFIAFLCPRRSRRASSLCFDTPFFRSGTYYYKPDNQHSCCPHYTIRYYVGSAFPGRYTYSLSSLDAAAFHSRREQRQAINRWNKYVEGQDYTHKAAILCPKSRE